VLNLVGRLEHKPQSNHGTPHSQAPILQKLAGYRGPLVPAFLASSALLENRQFALIAKKNPSRPSPRVLLRDRRSPRPRTRGRSFATPLPQAGVAGRFVRLLRKFHRVRNIRPVNAHVSEIPTSPVGSRRIRRYDDTEMYRLTSANVRKSSSRGSSTIGRRSLEQPGRETRVARASRRSHAALERPRRELAREMESKGSARDACETNVSRGV